MPRGPIHRAPSLFADSGAELKSVTAAYRANIDGGSRGNPGPAAYGVVVRDPRGEVVAKFRKYIGRSTNNVAEYYGLIAALDYAQQHGINALRVESDSELLVRQMRGQYKVKSAELRPLFERARKMSQAFNSFRIEHVYRERNAEADALANEAMDEASGAAPSRKSSSKPPTLVAKPQPEAIRARFENGTLVPINTLDLPEGAEVEVLVRRISK